MTEPGRPCGRVLASRLPRLGPRWVLVASGSPPTFPAGQPSAAVTVRLDALARGPGVVRGAPRALPVQSEAATGVLVTCPSGAEAAACIPEAARLLQPGGALLLVSTWTPAEALALDAVFTDCGLRTERRVAIRVARTEGPGSGVSGPVRGWIDAWRAARAGPDVPVECVVVASLPAHDAPAMPTGGQILASMFVPRRMRGPDEP